MWLTDGLAFPGCIINQLLGWVWPCQHVGLVRQCGDVRQLRGVSGLWAGLAAAACCADAHSRVSTQVVNTVVPAVMCLRLAG